METLDVQLGNNGTNKKFVLKKKNISIASIIYI